MDRPRTPSREELASELTPEALREDHLVTQAQILTGELLMGYPDHQEQLRLATMIFAAVVAHVAAPGRIEELVAHCAQQFANTARANYGILQALRAEAARGGA